MTDILNFIFSFVRNVVRIFTFSRLSSNDNMNIFIKCNSGRTLAVDLDPKWDIKNVKNVIAPKLGTNPEDVKIIFAGRELEDSTIIEVSDN